MLTPWQRHRAWRRINFRRTATLLSAEFLHGLYQRHDPFLNPFRFANTAVVFEPWQTNAYAPTREWGILAVRFGSRFLEQPERTCAELHRLLDNPRSRSHALAGELTEVRPEDLDDAGLGDLLTRSHHVPLGEIYEVNLVQVEHALHAAIRSELIVRTGDQARADRVLAAHSLSGQTTAAAAADASFLALVDRARQEGTLDPDEHKAELEAIVAEHHRIGSAYGADTASYAGLAARFARYAALPADRLPGAVSAADDAGLVADALLTTLFEALRRTGEVRDRNKQLLGSITRHQGALLSQIARRRGVDPEDLRLYLLDELLTLLHDRAEVPAPVIARRRAEGVVLLRQEGLAAPGAAALPRPLSGDVDDGTRKETLRGLCASGGSYTGVVRLVTSAADLERMNVGDILVAPGTDFDLIMLLRMAGAVVTEEGGLLSHAAVVARELGVPCLIGVADAMWTLTDGEIVTVDADEGVLRRQPRAADEPKATEAEAATSEVNMLIQLDAGARIDQIGRKADGLRTLIGAGLPVPHPVQVVPVEQCAAMAEGLRRGDPTTGRLIAAAIVGAFGGRRLSLRSSSLAEDTEEGTAAGIYHSEVGIPAEPVAVRLALERILASRGGDRAAAYHGTPGLDAPMAVLVAPYQVFEYQGTAVSHSPWMADRVLVEFAESDGTGGCPDGGQSAHFPHEALRIGSAPAGRTIPHLAADLRRVAAATLDLAGRQGGAVEVEWGLSAGELTFLQVRRLVTDRVRVMAH